MEQRIQMTAAQDGVQIAFAISGAGPILISVPSPPDNHLQLEWADPERRSGLEHLSTYRQLVRFDSRGTGLSDRDVTDFSLDARVSDLEAVVARVGADSFALMSGGHGNQVSVTYAARHPERVTHLIAVNPFARGSEFMSKDQLAIYDQMLRTDFKLFTDVVGAQTFGWGREEGPRYAAYFRACVEPLTAAALYHAMLEVDITEDLGRVTCPVLAIRPAEARMGTATSMRTFLATVPDVELAGISGAPVEGTTTEMVTRIGAFFGESWPSPATPAPPQHSEEEGHLEFRTVLFTDIEHHTSMMHRLGDVAGRDVLRLHEETTREALRSFGGTEVKTMGDGFLASFRSIQRALDCAISLQLSLSSESAALPDGFRIRVGINAGEPIEENGDLFGSSVITAARIVALAEGGEILVSNVVRELVAGKGHLFADRGQHVLRGFDEPMRVWSLLWQER
ncbi:MAG: adenylate/guanylate cyclase domain-containing protein [Tepidiformaceae bacterium]